MFALFIDDSKGGQAAFLRYLNERDCFAEQLKKNEKRMLHCRTRADLERALQEKKCAAILSVENGSMLNGQLDRLMLLEQDGVKLLTLTWFGENEIGFGSQLGGALKPFGREVVQALPRYGIVPDLSHLSDEGVEDVFGLYAGTVVASHSNVRSVTPHFRNLPDVFIREIVRRGGLIGINLFTKFLNRDAALASCDDVRRHLEALLALGAEDVVCFGSDFDGCEVPRDVADLSGMEHLWETLLRSGYSETLLQKLFFENARSFWSRQLGEETV